MTELQKAEQFYPTLKHALTLISDKRDGLVLEFGVMGGGSINMIRHHTDSNIGVVGFDTFTGLPTDWLCNGNLVVPKGTFDVGGNVPVIDGVQFYKGLFADTIPEFVADHNPESVVHLIHIDCDLYSSCSDMLNGIGHLIRAGCLLIFDEFYIYGNKLNNDGEHKAFVEWCSETNRIYEIVDFVDNVSADRVIIQMLN